MTLVKIPFKENYVKLKYLLAVFLNYFAVYMDVLNWIIYWKPELFEKKCQAAPPRIIAFALLLFLLTNLLLRPRTNVTTRGQKKIHIVAAFA